MHQELTAKKVLTVGGAIVLFGVIVGYGIWISRDLLFGIHSSVSGISDGMTVTDSLLSLSGKARHANDVTLDGSIVPIDQKGEWTDTIALLPGYNVVTIGASDKFGRTTDKSYRVYYTAPPSTGSGQAAVETPPATASSTPATATSTKAVQ